MKNKADKLLEMIKAKGIELTPEEIIAYYKCFVTRGKNKGYLHPRKPHYSKGDIVIGIWLAIQPNPFKTSPGAFMFLSDEGRKVYWKFAKTGEITWNYPTWLDVDSDILNNMGVW